MGQKRIKLNTQEEEQPQKTSGEDTKQPEKKETAKESRSADRPAIPRVRSKNYQKAIALIDRQKDYSPKEAISLIKKVSLSKFDGAVEVSAMTKKTGLKGEIKFPFSTGKSKVIKVASDQVVKSLEKGKVDFDILIASPETMPRLVKFAKLLGPRGLMPNPKDGTLSLDPEKQAKELAGKNQFKTEVKQPIIHQVIGKVSQKETELEANLKALIEAIGENNLVKVVISPSIGPGIKVKLEEK